MKRKPAVRVEDAVSMQRAGKLRGAEAAYRALLAGSPDDAFLLQRLGVLAARDGRRAEAEDLLRRALGAARSLEARLNVVLAHADLLRRADRIEEARSLVAENLPEWPRGTKPSPGERPVILSLARMCSALGEPEKGRSLLDRAFPEFPDDVELLTVAGRLRVESGDPAGALDPLARALRLAPKESAPLIALGAALARLDRSREARAVAALVGKGFPYYAAPRQAEQTETILVVNPPPRKITNPASSIKNLHFRVNYPAQFQSRMADRYRFLSVLGTISPELRPWEEDAPSLVVNNLVNEAEMDLPGAVERARSLLDRIGAPVINPPEAVAKISREKNAKALDGVPGLKVPRMVRLEIAEGGIDAVVAEIGRRIGYPAILRHPSTHSTWNSLLGKGPRSVYLVSSPGEAREALGECRWQSLFAIEFVDLRKKEGWYRKLRAICMGDETIVFHGGCYSDWIVAGWFNKPEGIAFYRANRASVDHLRAVLKDPRGELGEGCLEALCEVRKRIALDIFGIDFDVDDTGQVVFFEASAGMVMTNPRERVPSDIWLSLEPLERVHAAFHDLVARRSTNELGMAASPGRERHEPSWLG